MHEADELAHMVFAGDDVALHGQADVIHSEHEVVLLQDVVRPLDPVRVLEQGDDVTSPRVMDGGMEAG
jgi:hypothetical protein